MPEPEELWGPELQRLILASAIRGETLLRFPAAFRAELFKPLASTNRLTTPRVRIAEQVVWYFTKYAKRPTANEIAELVRRVGQTLGEEEKANLTREWQWVETTELPDDPQFLYDQVREAAEHRALSQAVVQAGALLDQGPGSLEQVWQTLEGARVLVDADKPGHRYVADSEERLKRWRMGDEMGEAISTGFPELDRVLNGGPRKKESFYFLAPPKGLKTASMLKVARAAAKRGLGVYLVTYEMQAMRMALRLDRSNARASRAELREDTTRLEKALEGLRAVGGGEIYIDERPPQQPGCVERAIRKVEQLRAEGMQVDVTIFDFLNIMGASKTEKEKRHELPRVSREIAAAGKELNTVNWSAALVNRQAVNKVPVRKTDIAEAFEIIAVLDGAIAICGSKLMVQAGYRSFYVTAAREDGDEQSAGDYKVDLDRMTVDPVGYEEIEPYLPGRQDGDKLGE